MDPTDLGPGTATWLGGSATVVLGGLLWLRRFLSKDATDRAMDSADIGTLKRLNELLNQERAARKEAEARADQFAKVRNDLAVAVGRMEGKIEALSFLLTASNSICSPWITGPYNMHATALNALAEWGRVHEVRRSQPMLSGSLIQIFWSWP